ncbi:hypothetical protein OIE66_10175 [Nonomuraea sp. NBC_01738]|uniref:hypothetical protein n=1 Tax=Nonomuraea sp. NBC_01738 TaxID=2976003 RepID=UPI002E16680B|nr:hypothetical protein OIE66_10175 [Nonomuraea sp. NBC_01738]
MTVISDSTAAWARVRDLVTARRTGDLADHVLALGDEHRAEVARRLPELRLELREAADRHAVLGWRPDPGSRDEDEDEAGRQFIDGIAGYATAIVLADFVITGGRAAVPLLLRMAADDAPRSEGGRPRAAGRGRGHTARVAAEPYARATARRHRQAGGGRPAGGARTGVADAAEHAARPAARRGRAAVRRARRVAHARGGRRRVGGRARADPGDHRAGGGQGSSRFVRACARLRDQLGA